MSQAPPFAGAVLAGGRSRRMGRDKAFLRRGGSTLLERAAGALRDGGADPVVVIGGDPVAVAACGLAPVPDRWPGEGPLGAIITALHVVPTEVVVVLPCDLTDPSSGAVTAVVDILGDADVAVPVVSGAPQWMHAAWHRRAHVRLEEAFEAGARSPRLAVRSLRIAHLLDGDPSWFHDADSPEDLLRPTPKAISGAGLGSIAEMDLPEIDVDELETRMAAGDPVFDVREVVEYETVRIDGAQLIPLGEVTESVDRFPTDRTVYLICAKGARSASAVEFLRGRGVDAVNVAGGMGAWLEADKPSVSGPGL